MRGILATPSPREALEGVVGALCAPYDRDAWARALAPLLADGDPRVRGRERAEGFSTRRMAARVREAWSEALERSGAAAG